MQADKNEKFKEFFEGKKVETERGKKEKVENYFLNLKLLVSFFYLKLVIRKLKTIFRTFQRF